jgi:renalase
MLAAGLAMSEPSSVAIIGAGMAGLSCAIALQSSGYSVTVFDKSRGLGGRMSTRIADGNQCDHGAQYFTARDTDFCAEVLRWQKAGAADIWSPKLQVIGSKPHRPQMASERFVGTPNMTAPAYFMAKNIPLVTETTLQQIERRHNEWYLCSAKDGWLSDQFTAVVLALPAPQVIPLLQPAAPEISLLAGTVAMHGCWALMLHFLVPTTLPFDAAFVNDGPLSWVARDSSKPQRKGKETWILHASQAWSEVNIEQEKSWVAHELLQAFYHLGGPTPASWVAHRWRYAKADPSLNLGTYWCVEKQIGLCGDWLNGGTVEGAWLSGKALARQIAQSLVEKNYAI